MTIDPLEAALGAPPPPDLADMDEDLRRRLAELVGRARDDQARALDQAIEGGLNHIPRPLRGMVRKALFHRAAAARPTSPS